MDKFLKFVPLTKVEEQPDGTLFVYGIVTAERPDRTKEICDYAKSVPYYKESAAEMLKATSIEGMETSLMPLREMHNLSAVGKGVKMDFDDDEKTIRMGFEVVEPSTIAKVKKGVLPMFSHGGDYVERYPDPKNPGYMRYVANPGEISLVDRGCLPGAVIETMKGRRFELVKRDGSVELVKVEVPAEATVTLTKTDLQEFAKSFADELNKSLDRRLVKEEKTKRKGGKDLHASDFAYVGDSEDTSTWKLPIHDAAHVRNALARFNQTEGIPADKKAKVKAKINAAAKKHGIEVSAEAEKLMHAVQYLQCAVEGKPLEKGMYEVSYMSEVLECIRWLHQSAMWERDFEGDSSTQPEDLETLLNDAVSCFLAMAEEEASEISETAAALAAGGNKAMKITEEALKKAAGHLANLHGHLKAAASAHEAHGSAMSGHLGKAMEACSKAMGEGGGEGGAASFDASGSGPHATDIRAGSSGSEAHQAKSFVSIGKTADGVEIFKAVERKDETEMDTDKLLAKLDEMITKRIDENATVLLKAVFAAMTGNTELLTKADPAPGVGDRSMVLTRPTTTEVVTKAADANAAGAGAAAAAASAAKPTTELYKAGLSGDQEARLKFARTIKRMSPEETSRVQGNLSSFARH